MDSKLFCFVACVLISLCDSAYVDTLIKCSFKDDKCVTGAIQKIIRDISIGNQDLNIPSFDPLDLKDKSIPILGLLNISVKEGQLTGVKDCTINNVHNDFDNGVTNLDFTCDLNVKGKFILDDISSQIQKMIGQEVVTANGNIIGKIEKLKMNLKIFHHIVRKDDGNIYFQIHPEYVKSQFEIGNVKVTVNKIIFGEQDLSEFIETFINQNWKSIVPSVGNGIVDFAMNILNDILNSFFNKVPAKYYYTEDLSPYVKN